MADVPSLRQRLCRGLGGDLVKLGPVKPRHLRCVACDDEPRHLRSDDDVGGGGEGGHHGDDAPGEAVLVEGVVENSACSPSS